jgi:hypothetical protein
VVPFAKRLQAQGAPAHCGLALSNDLLWITTAAMTAAALALLVTFFVPAAA